MVLQGPCYKIHVYNHACTRLCIVYCTSCSVLLSHLFPCPYARACLLYMYMHKTILYNIILYLRCTDVLVQVDCHRFIWKPIFFRIFCASDVLLIALLCLSKHHFLFSCELHLPSECNGLVHVYMYVYVKVRTVYMCTCTGWCFEVGLGKKR